MEVSRVYGDFAALGSGSLVPMVQHLAAEWRGPWSLMPDPREGVTGR